MFNEELTDFRVGGQNLKLKQVTEDDRFILRQILDDNEVKLQFLPKVWQTVTTDKIINHWLQNIKNQKGYAWIISAPGVLLSGGDWSMGFIACEHAGSDDTVAISFGLMDIFKRMGSMTLVVKEVFQKLIEQGVRSIEAVVDATNDPGALFLKSLGFNTYNSDVIFNYQYSYPLQIGLVYKKSLVDYSNIGYVLNEDEVVAFFSNRYTFGLYEETRHKDGEVGLEKTGRLKLLLKAEISPKIVGLGSSETIQIVTWELIGEEQIGPFKALVFTAWDTFQTPGINIFEGYRICLESEVMFDIIDDYIETQSNSLTPEILAQVVGLEAFDF